VGEKVLKDRGMEVGGRLGEEVKLEVREEDNSIFGKNQGRKWLNMMLI